MKYFIISGILAILAAAALFIWQMKALPSNGKAGPTPGGPAAGDSFISQTGTCPPGYRTEHVQPNCIKAPCPATTYCKKDALLGAMGGFTGFHNFPLN